MKDFIAGDMKTVVIEISLEKTYGTNKITRLVQIAACGYVHSSLSP